MPRPTASSRWSLLPALLAALVITTWADGHARNESYVWVNVTESGLEGRFEIRLSDLRADLGVPVADDPAAAVDDLRRSADRVRAYLLERFDLSAGGEPLELQFTTVELFDSESSLGFFAQYHYLVPDLDVPDELDVVNTILFETDPSQRSLLCIEFNERTGEQFGGEFTALVFSPANPEQTLDLTDIQGLQPARAFVWEGMRALLSGGAHLPFILALLLPTVMVRGTDGWAPAPKLSGALGTLVLWFVLFSLAHGLTLGLAGLDLVQAPRGLVEPVVVGSVIVLGLNTFVRRLGPGLPLVIFVLGLFHGLALAGTLAELPFRMMLLKRCCSRSRWASSWPRRPSCSPSSRSSSPFAARAGTGRRSWGWARSAPWRPPPPGPRWERCDDDDAAPLSALAARR